MAIKKIEIQDAEGNVYHPHSTSDVIFKEGKVLDTYFEEINNKFKTTDLLLDNCLKLYNIQPQYVQGGAVGIVDLGSNLKVGNYLLSICLNANTSGSDQYHSSLLYSLQIVTGWESGQLSSKVYLNPLGFLENETIGNVLTHNQCRALFATTGSSIKAHTQSSSIHVYITPYVSVQSIGFKSANLYKINI